MRGRGRLAGAGWSGLGLGGPSLSDRQDSGGGKNRHSCTAKTLRRGIWHLGMVTGVSEAKVRPEFLKALEDFDANVGDALKPRLREMIRLRVSHINGCSYCIRMHSEQLSALGARADLIGALARPVMLMRDDLISEGNAAALRFAEILTDSPRGLEREARNVAGPFFTRKQLGAIVETVAITNAWNRVTRGME